MKRESASKWQWFLPVVRLKPLSTIHIRLRSKLIWITNFFIGVALSKARIRGSRIIGMSDLGNVFLKLNHDCPVGKKNETVLIPRDLVIFESVRAKGNWEPKIVTFLAEPLINKNHSNPTSKYTFLDIGANSGLITRQVANIAERDFCAICIEPLKQNFEALSFNTSSRAKISQIELFPFALGDFNGEVDVFTEKANLGNTSLLKMSSRNVTKSRIMLRSTTEFIEENFQNFNRIILKCDTQGYETNILRQFSNNFWSRIDCGVIEIRSLPSINQSYVDQILSNLAHFPKIFWMDHKSMFPVDILEIRRFWLSASCEERDLCFSL